MDIEQVSSSISSPSDFIDQCDEGTWKDLEFLSAEEAFHFYLEYSRFRGFAVRKQNQRKKKTEDSEVTSYSYLQYECNKRGVKRSKHTGLVPVRTRKNIKTDCQAVIRFKLTEPRGVYKISFWNDNHNHEMMDADKTKFFPQNRIIQPAQKIVIDNQLNSGITQRCIYESMSRSVGGRENLDFLRVDLKNHIRRKREVDMLPGEASVLLKWLREQARSDPRFYYDIQVDSNEEICSIFWADSTMIDDYMLFGDFVSFDTTYKTNNHYRPLGVFVGFNHHKGTCIFGGALLYDETTPSFVWLFDTFLRCMNDKKPISFITDQAAAIGAAARIVFPGSFHALCSWHILRNARSKCGLNPDHEFFNDFNHLIYHVDTETEFEFTWTSLMAMCVEKNLTKAENWLKFIYTSREKWSSAWVKNYFMAGKTTTQLSEQFNAFSNFYLKPQYSLVQLLTRFKAMISEIRHNELKADFDMINTVPDNKHPGSSLMVHAAGVYSPKIFEIFQNQYDLGMSCICKFMTHLDRGSIQVIHVHRREVFTDKNSDLLEMEVVEVDMEKCSLSCSCRFYENNWILCRHILKVMVGLGTFGHDFCLSIPDIYIKARWTKAVRKVSSVGHVLSNSKATLNERSQQLCTMVVEAVGRIACDDNAYALLSGKLCAAIKEADLLMNSSSTSSNNSVCVSGEVDDTFHAKSVKKRNKSSKGETSKGRLKPEWEIRLLKSKQRRKEAAKVILV